MSDLAEFQKGQVWSKPNDLNAKFYWIVWVAEKGSAHAYYAINCDGSSDSISEFDGQPMLNTSNVHPAHDGFQLVAEREVPEPVRDFIEWHMPLTELCALRAQAKATQKANH